MNLIERDLDLTEKEVSELKEKTENQEQKIKFLTDSNRELYFDKKKLVQEKANQEESFLTFSPSRDTFSKSSQTCHNDEIPYSVTTALPPIFGSQLCYATKHIHHLSSSLPNLSTMNWVTVTEEDVIRDQAEEALNEQYDRKIAEFY